MSLTAVCLLLFTAPLLPIQQDEPARDGAVAEANRWYTRGGSAARTGVTETAVPRKPVEAAWSFTSKGTIEGEPLVWGEHIVVAIHTRGTGRELRVFDLNSGEQLGRRISFRTEVPLEPTIWGSVILVRAGPSRIEAYRIGKRAMRKTWTHRLDAPVGPPLLYEGEAYFCSGGAIERFVIGKSKPVWRTVANAEGEVSLLGGNVYATTIRSNGTVSVREFARSDGAPGKDWQVPLAPDPRYLDPPAPYRISLHPSFVVVDLGQEHEDTGRFAGMPIGSTGSQVGSVVGISEVSSFPIPWKDGWIGHTTELGLIASEEATFLTQAGLRRSSVMVYANSDVNSGFAIEGVSPTRAGNIGLVGSRAFDLDSCEVLWRRATENVGRAIPAANSVLVVEDGKRLVCLQPKGRQTQALQLAEPVPNGTLVLRSGEIETGDFRLQGDTLLQAPINDEMAELRGLDFTLADSWPSTGVMAIFDSEGRIVASSSSTLAIRAIDLLEALETGPALLKLAKAAGRSGSASLMRDMIQAAWDLGVDVPTRLEKQLETLSKKNKPKTDERAVERVSADWKELYKNPAAGLWACFKGRHESMPQSLEFALLRECLKRDPQFEPARNEIFSRARASIAQDVNTDALDWMDYLEATAATPIRVWHHPAGKKDSETEHAERLIARAQAKGWRKQEKDLLGFESENLLVLSSVKRPGAVARCLAMGEVVCKALDDLFSEGQSVRDERYPLTINLYSSKEEYLQQSSLRHGGEAGSGLAWTAGHFSSAEGLSRLFIPADETQLENVMATFAHELTHHWLALRCPLYSLEESRMMDPTMDGYWIVEGFASMIGDCRFDPSQQTWDLTNPYSMDLEMVARAEMGGSVSWKKVFEMSQAKFHKTKLAPEHRMTTENLLGARYPYSDRRMFYAQASAAANYLVHHDRAKLLEYIRAYYTRDADALSVKDIFGMSPQNLGRKVREHAREKTSKK